MIQPAIIGCESKMQCRKCDENEVADDHDAGKLKAMRNTVTWDEDGRKKKSTDPGVSKAERPIVSKGTVDSAVEQGCLVVPPLDGDDASVHARELLEGTGREVKVSPVAGGAGVGNDGLDGLAVALDRDSLTAKAAVHLGRVDSNDRVAVRVVLTARARVSVLVEVGGLAGSTGSLLHGSGNNSRSGGESGKSESGELHVGRMCKG